MRGAPELERSPGDLSRLAAKLTDSQVNNVASTISDTIDRTTDPVFLERLTAALDGFLQALPEREAARAALRALENPFVVRQSLSNVVAAMKRRLDIGDPSVGLWEMLERVVALRVEPD